MIDLYLVYSFIKLLVKPFTQWDAYKHGLIDRKGKLIKPRSEMTKQEKKYLTKYDLLVKNIKRVLEQLPGGRHNIASYAAALWLIREHKNINIETITEEDILKGLINYAPIIQEEYGSSLFTESLLMLSEEGIVNVTTNFAGLGENPPVSKEKQRKYRDRNKHETDDKSSKDNVRGKRRIRTLD